MGKIYKILFLSLILLVGGIAAYLLIKIEEGGEFVLYGNIDIRQAELGFRVFGKLERLFVEEGDKVAAGDLLAELDPTPYENSLREAEGRMLAIKSNLLLAAAQLDRRGALVKGQSVSVEDFQKALYNQKALTASLGEAQGAFENAKIKLGDTKLKAPSDGVIFTRVREPGTVLDVGNPVYVLSVTNPVWARTYVSETNLGRIYPGRQAEIYTDTKSNPVYKGHVGFISPIAEFTPKSVETPDLRTDLVFQVRVIIDNPDEGLRQGMPVTIKFPNG